jgi:hypothetical protein
MSPSPLSMSDVTPVKGPAAFETGKVNRVTIAVIFVACRLFTCYGYEGGVLRPIVHESCFL